MLQLLPGMSLDDATMVLASARFVKAFNQAWGEIPEDHGAVICGYFQHHPALTVMCFRMDYTEGAREAWGRCLWFNDSTLITFSAPFVERADPIGAVASVIAHELAHCYRKGSRTWTANGEEEEEGTKMLTAGWGFTDPSPGEGTTWDDAVAGWRRRHAIEFGQFTEGWWVARHQASG
jgi:hypothetical protein